MTIVITHPDGSTETRRSYQRLATALDERCPFRINERVIDALREQRATIYGCAPTQP